MRNADCKFRDPNSEFRSVPFRNLIPYPLVMVVMKTRRPGFSLMELIAVLVALVILGAILVPTLSGMRGDTRTKAGSDILQSYIAKARERAIEDGFAYRLAISADGKRIRIAPDTFEAMGEMPTVDEDAGTTGPTIREDDLPEGVTALIVAGEDDFIAQDQSGWKRVATFMPDGTCKEDLVEVRVEESGVVPMIIRLKGVTGTAVAQRDSNSNLAP
jgi:prepilin-type N-terminal cleavage/methylation domain-containing protein